MEGRCKNTECAAPITSCHLLIDDLNKCQFWTASSNTVKNNNKGHASAKIESDVNWSGNPFDVQEVSLVSARNSPIIIGLIGKAEAGKSSYLGMLFTLLLNGKHFNKFHFAGSKTIFGWETLAASLRYKRGNVSFPAPTPSSPDYYSLLHLALRDNEEHLHDVLFTDTSGEVFLQWAYDREDENAASARWIHENSNAFIFFIDCQALIDRRNAAKTEIIDIAQQLKQNINGRPVAVIWSKSDEIDNVKEVIKLSLKEDIREIFSDYTEIEVANFSRADPDKLCHENNIEVVDWLFERVFQPSKPKTEIDIRETDDFFLNYRG